MISDSSANTSPHAKATHSKVVDGFVARKSNSIKPKSIKQHYKAVPSTKVHSLAKRSETLMRHIVNKPAKNKSEEQKKVNNIKLKNLVNINPEREKRAAKIPKNRLISKFGRAFNDINIKVAKIPVKPAPSKKSVSEIAHGLSVPIDSTPIINTSINNTFDLAIQKAESHKQPKIKKVPLVHRTAAKLKISPRALGVISGIVAIFIATGLTINSQMSELMVKVASTKAGVNAKLPSYKPSGFSLEGPVRYASNQITLLYDSNSDDRNFTITQKKSDWNSQALLDNYVKESNKSYQTRQENGKTIYIYNGNNATWVSGGIWYQIEGESSLNSDQLIRIADSL